MSESGYTRITWSGTGVYVLTTHRATIIEMIKELRETLPDLSATYTGYLEEGTPHPMDLYQREVELRISKLDTRDQQVAFWFVQHLCQRGWEPFQVGRDEYHLRPK